MPENIAPTKWNLMQARNSLELAEEGFELLDKKRHVLIREMMGLIDKAQVIQGMINDIFSEAYQALQQANITIGISTVEDIARAVDEDNSLDIKLRSVMGVEIPRVRADASPIEPRYSFYRTNPALDRAFKNFNRVKHLIVVLAEVENSVYRLAVNIRQTQKRANALQNIVIPRYRKMIKFIEDVLEEREREDFIRLKMIKAR